MMLENKIYWALASLQLLGVVAAIVAVAVNVDASISLMSSNSQARSFSLSESWGTIYILRKHLQKMPIFAYF